MNIVPSSLPAIMLKFINASFIFALVVSLLPAAMLAEDTKFAAAEVEFFEKEVRPLLVKRCYECHTGKEPKGGLLLNARDAIIAGGETGPAIKPGNPEESLLIESINYAGFYNMPPKSKLPKAEVDIFTKWVKLGAPWPAGESAAEKPTSKFDLSARKATHWAWRPLADPAVPKVVDNEWPKDDIDRFLLHKMEGKSLTPNSPAEKRVLIRRVTFAITGLPPTPAEINDFLRDESPAAYEKVVDRLLDSKHFGERWGRHWLDLVRYAESRGHEFDYNAPNTWRYRDYVIRAINEDVPYDQWLTEHLAGDLLAKPRMNTEHGFNESVLGTGFWHLGEWVHSPVDLTGDEADRYDNMIDVFSKTFLGLTVSCARCHDHKFDAISQADYYALASFLQSSAYRQVRFETEQHNGEIAKQLEAFDREAAAKLMQTTIEDREPVSTKLAQYLLASRSVLAITQGKNEGNIAEIAKAEKLNEDVLQAWVKHLQAIKNDPTEPFYLWAKAATQPEATSEQIKTWAMEHTLKTDDDKSLPPETIVNYTGLEQDQWLAEGYTFGLQPARRGSIDWIRPEQPVGVREFGAAVRDPAFNGLAISAGSMNDQGKIGGWNRAGRTFRTPVFELKTGMLRYRFKGEAQVWAVVDSHRMLQGPLHGTHIKTISSKDKAAWATHEVKRYIGHRMHLEFVAKDDQPFELYEVRDFEGAIADEPKAALRFLSSDKAQAADTPEKLVQLLHEGFEHALNSWRQSVGRRATLAKQHTPFIQHYFNHKELWLTGEDRLNAKVEALRTERTKIAAKIKKQSHLAPAMWDGSTERQALYVRGNPKIKGELLPPRSLTALGGDENAIESAGSGRLQLAEQLLNSTQTPLTSRVAVNRIWHHLFGRGIVPSVDNFGVLGEEPSHPELLDHVASRFIREGWSTKRMIKTIVMTQAYRMSSEPVAKNDAIDPENILLHRMPLLRLEGEAIRDSVLAISGRFDATMYGPSVPVYLTPFMQGRGRPGQGPLDGNGRRSIYISIRRNFLSPMMLAFDAPQPFSTVGRRTVSNVPAQALIMMNDPFIVQQAKLWAERELKTEATAAEHIQSLYETAFARPATDTEVAAGEAFLKNQAAQYQLPADGPLTDVRLWHDYCHVLMNVKEFIFIR